MTAITPLKIRTPDKFGAGHFGAKRGGRTHIGVDIVAIPGQPCQSLCDGVVTKYGYPYADDLTYRYVEVTNLKDGFKWRYFYVTAAKNITVGTKVKRGDIIGYAQTLQKKYPGITDHIHFEILGQKNPVDPTPFVLGAQQ